MSLTPDPAASFQADPSAPAYGTPPVPPQLAIQDEPTGAPGQTGWDEVRTRTVLMAFDGRILELFGDLNVSGSADWSLRFHVANVRISITDLGQGWHRVSLAPANSGGGETRVRRVSGSVSYASVPLSFYADEWAIVGPFLERVAAAAARFQA